MKKIIKWIGIGLGSIAFLIGAAYGAMRMNDGPVEFWPWFTISIGGPFRSGELAPSPADWSFIEDRKEIEIQTLNPTTSRTVWVPVIDGRLYLVSGYMNSYLGRLWKQWPSYLAEDNRILIRIDGEIYEQRLERIMEGPITDQVMSEVVHKYFGAPDELIEGSGAAITSGSAWLFEVVPR